VIARLDAIRKFMPRPKGKHGGGEQAHQNILRQAGNGDRT
jgi:hypothetical protein